jgi:C1A family cysteine protease
MKVQSCLPLLLLLLSTTFIHAQTPSSLSPRDGRQIKALGVVDQQLIDQLMVVVTDVGSRSRELQQQQSLKPFLMPVRHLGIRGADWSYTLAMCLEYYVNLQRNFKDNLSPDFISVGLRSLGQNASVTRGLEFLAREGTVSAAIMPYDADQIPSAVYATTKYRINNYLHLFQVLASTREKTFEVRKALIRGNPVIVEFQADQSLGQLQATRSWEGNSETPDARYSLLVVGFDEERQAFEVRSSLGPKWADNGYLWIKYRDFGQGALNGYVMVPEAY